MDSGKERHMELKLHKKPNTRFVETDMLLEWISPECSENGEPLVCRVPEPEKRKYHACFTAGGKKYRNIKQMTSRCMDAEKGLYKDSFGRNVILVKELFPCFDSFDYAAENRYYRWHFLIWKEKLICVHSADDSRIIEVTEDVAVLSGKVWESMQAAGILGEDMILRL